MSVAMQPVGALEASILARASEARRRLMGQPVKEPPRPKTTEDVVPPSRVLLPHAKAAPRPATKPKRAPASYRNKATAEWTPERVQTMLTLWREGHSASEIAKELGGGITRSAVCGKAWRLRNPFDAALSSRVRKKQPKKANKAKSHSNVTKAAAAPKAKAVVVALPVHGVSDADLVKGWLAQNGGPRRFATGDSGDTFAMKSWLWERGYEMTYVQKRLAVRKAGSARKPQRMDRQQLVAFVDKLRAAEGLEAIVR